jgi:hypothetical protein
MPIYGLGDLVIVNPSSWKMSSDLTVASQTGISDRGLGVDFSWAPPAGLTVKVLTPRESYLIGPRRYTLVFRAMRWYNAGGSVYANVEVEAAARPK